MKTYEDVSNTPQRTVITLGEGAFLHTSTAGAWLPFEKALISGLIAGVLAVILSVRFWPEEWLFITAITTVGTVAAVWIFFQMLWVRLNGLVEMVLKRDLNNDGFIGEQPAQAPIPQTVRVEVTDKSGGGHVTNYIDLPFAERIPQLAAGLAAGKQFTVAAWVGQSRGRLFNPSEFIELREAMLEHGWIVANNPHDETRGYSLTRAGAEVMRSLAG